MPQEVRDEVVNGVVVHYANEREEAAYKAGYADAYEFYVLEKGGMSDEVMSKLRWLADTPGKDFSGDVGKTVEWLIWVAHRHEPWVRFQMDLHTEHERRKVSP